VARYTAEVSDADTELVYSFFVELGPDAEEIIMSTADRWREQGRTAGLAEGRAAGVAATLIRQLNLKFGPLSASALARVQAASSEDLERWTDRVLTAASLDDVIEE
jgi:hypothetical protein